MAKVCIISEKVVESSYPVEDDLVIGTIRFIKRSLGIAKNNELVVSAEHIEEYRKKRQAYERKIAFYGVIAAIIFVILGIVPIFGGGFSLPSLIVGIALAVLIILLAVVTSHTPKISDALDSGAKPPAQKKANAGKKK